MNEQAIEKLSLLGLSLDENQEHMQIPYRNGSLLVWKNLSSPGYCLAYDDEEGTSILMRTNLDLITEEIRCMIRDSRIDELLG